MNRMLILAIYIIILRRRRVFQDMRQVSLNCIRGRAGSLCSYLQERELRLECCRWMRGQVLDRQVCFRCGKKNRCGESEALWWQQDSISVEQTGSCIKQISTMWKKISRCTNDRLAVVADLRVHLLLKRHMFVQEKRVFTKNTFCTVVIYFIDFNWKLWESVFFTLS